MGQTMSVRNTVICAGGFSLFLWFTSRGKHLLDEARIIDDTMIDVQKMMEFAHPEHKLTQKMSRFCHLTHFLRNFGEEDMRSMSVFDFVHLVKDKCSLVVFELHELAKSLQKFDIDLSLAKQFVNLATQNLTLLRDFFVGVYIHVPEHENVSAEGLTRNLDDTLYLIKSF